MLRCLIERRLPAPVSVSESRGLRLFGSAVTDHFDSERSDFDFFVDFQPQVADLLGNHLGLNAELERITGRKVDLVMTDAVENPTSRPRRRVTHRTCMEPRSAALLWGPAHRSPANPSIRRCQDVGRLRQRCPAPIGCRAAVRGRGRGDERAS